MFSKWEYGPFSTQEPSDHVLLEEEVVVTGPERVQRSPNHENKRNEDAHTHDQPGIGDSIPAIPEIDQHTPSQNRSSVPDGAEKDGKGLREAKIPHDAPDPGGATAIVH